MNDSLNGAHTASVGKFRNMAPAAEQRYFVLKPMLQLGSKYGRSFPSTLELVWHAYAGKRHWRLFIRAVGTVVWKPVKVKKVDSVEIEGRQLYRLSARFESAESGSSFEYELHLDDEPVFSAVGNPPVPAGSAQRVIVFGDFADGGRGASAIAAAAYSLSANLIVMPGDIVYKSGLFSEYCKHLQPVLNGPEPNGVGLAASTVVVAAVGNHDVRIPDHEDERQHSSLMDLFAYFRTWRHPHNGPELKASVVEEMVRRRSEGRKLLDHFGPRFIKRSNFSFFQGDAQWVVLDANKYMDWRQGDLQKWLRNTLEAGKDKKWKLVSFHQPGFNSDAKYRNDQRMRVLAPIFEEFAVDVVFSGHCHFYERHRPIKFRPHDDESGKKRNPRGIVTIDVEFDGASNCRPNGVIYIISGAGGTLLKPSLRPSKHGLSQSSACLCEDRNSLTVLDFGQRTLTIRQVDPLLKEIDCIVIEKT